MKKIKVILFFLICCIFANNIFGQITKSEIYKFTQVLNNIDNYYTDSVDGEKLVEKAIISTLKELDPHSNYFTKDELEELQRGLKGSFDGIGITYNILKDTILILSTMNDGPSEKAGILAGDRLIKIESVNVAGNGVTHKIVKTHLLGKKGTEVNVSVKRRGNSDLLDFAITRDKIAVHSIDAAYMVNKNVAYIKLRRFSATSQAEFKKAEKELKKQGAKHLILDLRNNGGGYLKTAVDITDNFLKSNKMIVYTKGENSKTKKYKSTASRRFEKGRLIILINENSASASEIVSGAIQDWDRGIIIGRRSFGKGLVQKPFYLIDGSMMRLTIARYFTPVGRCIQKPYDKGKDEYYKDLSARLKNGELITKDSIHFPDSLKYYTMNKKRLVYGGGGIMPDIFVPLDTTKFPQFYKNLKGKNNINLFVHDYVDKNREYFNTVFSDFEKYYKNFKVDEKLLKELLLFADTEKKDMTILEELKNNIHIKTRLKALIANDIWNTEEFYKINNKDSDIFLKAVEIISNRKKYSKIFKNKKLLTTK